MGITVHCSGIQPGLNRTCVLLCQMIIFVQLLLSSVHCHAFGSHAPVQVAHDAPVGTIVLDLMQRSDTSVPQHSVVSLDTSDYSHLFRLNDKRQIVIRASISRLQNSIITLDILISDGAFERVVPVAVHIVGRPTVRFTHSVFNGTIAGNAAVNSQIVFDQRISAQRIGSTNARYAIVSGNTQGLFKLVTKHDPYQDSYALLFVASPLVDASGVHELRIKAVSENNGEQFATAVLRVTVEERPREPPVFTAQRYVVSVSPLAPQTTVLRVSATTSKGDVMYRLEPEDIPFDVTPWSGDIFSSQWIDPGRYTFNAVAVDSVGQTTFVSVKIIVEEEVDPLAKKPHSPMRRSRRDLGSDMVITLHEDIPLGTLQHRLDLLFSERIRDAPVVKNFITIHANGSIELTKPLNYEDVNPVEATVFVDNVQGGGGKSQRVIINVLDVDEPPAFVNGQKPFLAVVSLNPPKTGLNVFQFVARDENGDGDADVEYRLINTEPPGMFRIEPSSGIVRTTRTEYELGKTYRVFVQARDRTPQDSDKQDSEIAVLEVLAGDRPPQFVQQHYTVGVPEDTDVEASVVDVKAHGFKSIDGRNKGPITYSLFTDENSDGHGRLSSDAFSIDSRSGVVHLQQKLDFDDGKKPRLHKLRVVAAEAGLESEVPLEITVTDTNDNPPVFTLPLYTATIKEDIAIGSLIVKVRATDKDTGRNAAIHYEVDDDHFSVNDHGDIEVRKRLDADQKSQGFHIYRFNVTARDMGEPSLSSKALVHIRTENTNDESPYFIPTRQYTAYVAEDAQGGTPIVTIQALDPDRDQVSYSFLTPDGETSATELFEIDKDTGLIKLRMGTKPEDLSQNGMHVYNLTVQAKDDGSCCGPASTVIHKETATVLIGIADVNNNKPEFHECSTYSAKAKIEEGVHKNGAVIIKVVATDDDSPPNGDIVYSLYYPKSESRKPFIIDPITGELRPSPYVMFDRETLPFEDVTVKATDKGERPLIGFCQFTVTVTDVNDNAPQFDRASYETSISRTMAVGHSVVTVFADDRDAPPNARITYELKADEAAGEEFADDPTYFRIMKSESGEVTLTNSIPPEKTKFKFLVVANDNGSPEPQKSEVSVVINLHKSHQSAPQWKDDADCPAQTEVAENIQVNSVLFRCHAVSGANPDNPILYSMANGVKRSTNSLLDFREFLEKRNGRDWVVVRNLKVLDYEKTSNYTLTLTATDLRTGVTADKQLRVLLVDKNDEVPRFTVDRFTGTIDEEVTPEMFATKFNNQPITVVEAVDADSPGPQSDVRYSILKGPASTLFRIDERTGGIFPLMKFDREKNDSFVLDVEARDAKNSDLPGAEGPNKDIVKVQIFIGDINDNAPYFNKTSYQGRIAENAEIGQGVMTVKAHDADRDSNLKYDLKGKNSERIEFGVRADSGTIFVKEPLDFETRKEYALTLLVTDGKHESNTSIFILIEDVNDNAPQFSQPLYETTIQEEDGHVPKTLFTVKATDRDQDIKSRDIVYRLEGQGVGEFFQIDEKSGQINALRPLDRDLPAGVPTWKFIVQAIDDGGRGMTGYADVQVNLRDINDNAPFFPNDLVGFVDENREPGADGVFVMTASATDYDDPITPNAELVYGIVVNKELNGQPVFTIDPRTGKIFARMKLDRENPAQRQFVIEVRASDKGRPPLYGVSNVTIKVVDVNDNAPFFEQKQYSGSVAETASVGAAVLSVSAQDADTEAADNVLQYELVENNDPGLQYFFMTSEADSSSSHVGVLRVKKPLDYEDPTQRDGFRLEVKVFDGKFSATAKLFVKVDDRNDNPPEIHGPPRANVSEDALRGTLVARFTTVDRDLDGKDTATFRIARESDPKRQFSISQGGELTVAQPLDREDIPYYDLKIEAFDQVGNVGSQRIEIYLIDVNDNAPDLYTVPNPCIFMENTDPSQIPPCEIFGKDPDTRPNGPPFQMRVDPSNPYASLVNIVFDQNGDGGNGSMTVTAKVRFDREDPSVGKVLNIPIFVKDSGANATEARRIVQIIIGDENDNPMTDGSMTILVNSYLGQLEQTVIGRVYVTDKDDWDLPDKTFEWSQSLPGFDLNPNNGQITMVANKAPGSYDLSVSVTDHKRNEKAIGTVTVVVKEIPDIAFRNQGAIRLLGRSKDSQTGITKADFIQLDASGQSPMTKFIAKLSNYLGGVQVDVFSVMDGVAVKQNSEANVVDVRYAAHGSPYRTSVLLNGIVSQHRAEFEKEMGVQIIGISIDMCKFTQCDSGCQTVDTPSTKGVTVDANATALVGIFATSKDNCVCPVFFPPTSCQLGLCQNDGVCHNTYPGFFCECRNSLLKGSRCQGRTRSFEGKGFAWYKPMPACTSLNISFEFMTTQPNALLFYGGPMSGTDDPDILYNDYVVIKLLNGLVSASLNFNGNGVNQLDVMGQNAVQLNDGRWHTVALIQEGQDVELIVDNCDKLQENGGGVQGTRDDSSCRTSKRTFDDDERLNIVDPVQIGGVAATDGGQYPQGVADVGALNGCIRNLVVNSDLYDLATPAYSEGSSIGCKLWGSACDSNSVESSSYCINGDCSADMNGPAKCDCDPGYRGDRCDKEIQWVEFGSQSFIEYMMKVPLNSTTTKVEVLFLPGKLPSGELGFGKGESRYISTAVDGDNPSAKFDLDFRGNNGQTANPVQLQMTWLRLQDNGSYWMQFERNPTRASLSIDGVYHLDQLLDPQSQNFQMSYDGNLLLGAETIGGTNDFQGCVGDFRWDYVSLPLAIADEENKVAPITNQKAVVPGCSLRRTCAQLGASYCPGSFKCVDFWKGPMCTCPAGATANIGEDGTLIGCGATLAVSSLGISSKAVVLILICLLVLIMLVLIMVVYTRRQTPPFQRVQPEEMSRENMRPYDIEGGGEADNDTYNISGLRKPVMPPAEINGLNGRAPSIGPHKPPAPGVPVDDNLKAMIRDLEADPNVTAPYDELRVYDDEGDGVSQCSLSSLSSSGSDPGELDERLERWGPRFQKLAGMYAGQEE